MEQVHLAGDEDDELYSGYNDYNPLFDTEVSQRIKNYPFINRPK